MKFLFSCISSILVFTHVIGQTVVGSSNSINLRETRPLIIIGGIGVQTFDNYLIDENTEQDKEEIKEDEAVLISFPNPSNNHITFGENFDDSEDIQIYNLQIFNISGTLIKTINRITKCQQVDISDLPEGFFLLKLTGIDEKKEKSFKFI